MLYHVALFVVSYVVHACRHNFFPRYFTSKVYTYISKVLMYPPAWGYILYVCICHVFPDGCPMEQGPPYQTNSRITWPELDIGQTATESCACGSLNTSELNYHATRVCGGNYSSGGEWETQDVSRCIFSDTTLELCRISEVSVHSLCI